MLAPTTIPLLKVNEVNENMFDDCLILLELVDLIDLIELMDILISLGSLSLLGLLINHIDVLCVQVTRSTS